ncbi:MAG: hypothetical protein FJX51_02705 [Alphaproteobacteria bacterium]|nr:hypothetical protein [Alphaproteobacteria bacterium]
MGNAAGDVFLEFHRIGPFVKATAIDPESLVEVSVVGPSTAGEDSLARAAVKKLSHVLQRRLASSGAAPAPVSGRGPAGRGTLI